ncbi:MAG: PIG-L family deacetylase [Nitrolancea sp.]
MSLPTVRIMAIGAHPGDSIERAGGTVAKHVARGDEAMMVSLTSGAVTHAFNLFPATGDDKLKDFERIVAQKKAEFGRGVEALSIPSWHMFEFRESPLAMGMDEYVAAVNLIREFKPTVVLCPHPVEVGRQDHMDCGRFVIAAVDFARADGFPSPLAPHTVKNLFLYYYEDFRSEQMTGTPRHSPEVVVDISSVIEKKHAAMMELAGTQTKESEDYGAKLDRFLNRVDGAAGYMHGFEYAERFSRWEPERLQYLPVV